MNLQNMKFFLHFWGKTNKNNGKMNFIKKSIAKKIFYVII